ncbi:uncharacterized protein MELLADRAFT_123763 [Melampsora larici-populina 98AG31]|uniref:Secreted protein n=1 Tax=Melampsora larici-populina (strain 98AG31 / pathotype 3-4-7) TaxID=747676 RepID=F4R485_MELLP|nr:uncharacterized protein MELLADRAFT_123763 [Melampsora larici-populina 98AG31]EGG13041.1 secreted protein [Melampsora larici-populina 98AG31]
MLHFFKRFTFLLFSLWIHGLKADIWPCTQQLTMIPHSKDTAVCKVERSGVTKTFHCNYASCWSGYHQWTPLSNCQLVGSPDKGFSVQQCAHYEYMGNGVYACYNPKNVPYLCRWNDISTFISMGCTDCYVP